MEKRPFTPHGGLALCNSGGMEIELNPDGETARFRLYGDKVTRWCKIRYNAKGEAFCNTPLGRAYIHNFMRY